VIDPCNRVLLGMESLPAQRLHSIPQDVKERAGEEARKAFLQVAGERATHETCILWESSAATVWMLRPHP
jgi:hypothetical protein